jgi:hypothetical protein
MQPTLKTIIFSILFVFCNFLSYSQNALEEVGRFNTINQEITFTGNLQQWKTRFENRLNATGVIVDQIQIIGRVEGDQSKFLIIGKVSNHPEGLNLIGWELSLQNGIIVFDSTGPGIEHTCTGSPCNSCSSYLDKRLAVHCECKSCPECGEETPKCNHTLKVVVF